MYIEQHRDTLLSRSQRTNSLSEARSFLSETLHSPEKVHQTIAQARLAIFQDIGLYREQVVCIPTVTFARRTMSTPYPFLPPEIIPLEEMTDKKIADLYIRHADSQFTDDEVTRWKQFYDTAPLPIDRGFFYFTVSPKHAQQITEYDGQFYNLPYDNSVPAMQVLQTHVTAILLTAIGSNAQEQALEEAAKKITYDTLHTLAQRNMKRLGYVPADLVENDREL